ncbi:MAG TPA: flagellar export protein FliJ [Desulfotomaculum sp.]|nr:MAG: hypothetical protein VR67_16440 [Peptococcaceae bacterium BRH_c8a]KJS76630.1 MAG: hypothetical protein JL56_05015 [Desulfotomaculum sp. BICA1-6]HBX23702.1 flagellar export protein FliJ [Desulfotomaculum sp.]
MRKFDFRLEPVLKHREILEEQAAAQKASAQNEYRHHQDILNEARNKLAGATRDDQALNPFDMFNKLAYCDYMTSEVKRRETALNVSRHKLEKCRKNLVKTMQDRSVMEKLREKKLNIYNQTVVTAEQKETDEMAVLMYNVAVNSSEPSLD